MVYQVQNSDSVIYNNFTFIDGNGINKIIDLLPNVSYYINGNVVVSPVPTISIINLGKEEVKYCFQSCCNGDIFDFDGMTFNIVFGTYQLNDVIYFDQAISSSNPNNIKSGCYQLISSGNSGSHSCSVNGSENVSVVVFNSSEYNTCEECSLINDCCTNYLITNQSAPNAKTKIEFTPCCGEEKTSPYFIPYQTSISICSSTGVKTIGEARVINNGNCPNCDIITTTTTQPSVTTTTTLFPIITPIEPKNECDVITIFPLNVECFALDPTSSSSFDGALTLGITGGTPPYEVVWENGSLAQSLSNIGVGEYSSIVTDYYGDFTAYTTCILSAQTPMVTTTTTIVNPLPVYEDICITIIRGNKLQSFVEYYQFLFNGYIGNYPTWTDSINNLDIVWNETNIQWEVSGWSPGQLINTNPSTPPLIGWNSLGSTLPYKIISVSVALGDCQLLSMPNLTIRVNDPECKCDGSIILTPFGGNPPYTYSINGGLTYDPTTIYNNLCSGTYVVYIKDSSGFTSTQTVSLLLPTSSISYVLTLAYNGSNSFDVNVFPPLPIGTILTYDVVHVKTFTVGPLSTSATYLNTVTLNVNGSPVPFTPPVQITNNTPIIQPFPCQGSLQYTTIRQSNWVGINMGVGSVVTGSFTNAIAPILPTPQCFVAETSFNIYINNVSINNNCDTVLVVNPKPQ